MAAHAFNPTTREAEAGGSLELKARANSRTANKTTQRNPVSITKQTKNQVKPNFSYPVDLPNLTFIKVKQKNIMIKRRGEKRGGGGGEERMAKEEGFLSTQVLSFCVQRKL